MIGKNPEYKPTVAENSLSILPQQTEELLALIAREDCPFWQRLQAANILAIVGDPRISAIELITLPAAEVSIGWDWEELPAI